MIEEQNKSAQFKNKIHKYKTYCILKLRSSWLRTGISCHQIIQILLKFKMCRVNIIVHPSQRCHLKIKEMLR